MKVSIIVPMFNEEKLIASTIETLTLAFASSQFQWELLLVNDGSDDNTLDICKKYSLKNNNIRLISYSRNCGRGKALRVGLSSATGDLILTTEADLTWGTEILFKMISEFDDSSIDIVIASPYTKGGKIIGVPLFRRTLSRLGNKVLGFAVGGNLTMVSGMTRCYRKKVIELLDLESNGKEIHLEIISKAMALGSTIKEIPAVLKWEKNVTQRRLGKHSFKYGRYILSHLSFSFNEAPFLLLGTIGVTMILLGMITAIYAIYLEYTINLKDRLPLITLIITLLVVGVQILIFLFLANQNREIRKEIIRTKAKVLEHNNKK